MKCRNMKKMLCKALENLNQIIFITKEERNMLGSSFLK